MLTHTDTHTTETQTHGCSLTLAVHAASLIAEPVGILVLSSFLFFSLVRLAFSISLLAHRPDPETMVTRMERTHVSTRAASHRFPESMCVYVVDFFCFRSVSRERERERPARARAPFADGMWVNVSPPLPSFTLSSRPPPSPPTVRAVCVSLCVRVCRLCAMKACV